MSAARPHSQRQLPSVLIALAFCGLCGVIAGGGLEVLKRWRRCACSHLVGMGVCAAAAGGTAGVAAVAGALDLRGGGLVLLGGVMGRCYGDPMLLEILPQHCV
eukprot:13570457-Alexandrium_andersonii.AAC.1